ncbi:MAG: response regulator [Aggregatilineales bacterium]
MNILYLEDEPLEANLVQRYINATRHQLVHVSTLTEARAALNKHFDLILVDLRIDHARQGYDFVQEMRAAGYMTTIIAVTGLTFQQDLDRCYEVGCNDILIKPYTITQLDAIIKKYTV